MVSGPGVIFDAVGNSLILLLFLIYKFYFKHYYSNIYSELDTIIISAQQFPLQRLLQKLE